MEIDLYLNFSTKHCTIPDRAYLNLSPWLPAANVREKWTVVSVIRQPIAFIQNEKELVIIDVYFGLCRNQTNL